MRAVLFVFICWSALCACGPDIGPVNPWIPWAQLPAPLRPEVNPPAAANPTSGPLRVVTFNVHYGADVDALAAAIQGHPVLAGADLLLLQEIESHPEEGRSRAARLAQALAMGHAYVPARTEGNGTHGLALLSRLLFEDLQVMELPRATLFGGAQRRIAFSCDVRLGEVTLRVVNVHLDTRLNLSERILQLRPVAADVVLQQRALLAGDLNTNDYIWAGGAIPQLPAQSATGAGQAAALDDYMKGLGYAAPTQDLGPTWTSVLGLRLDAIYTRGLVPIRGAVARDVDVSDHWPLWLEVRP